MKWTELLKASTRAMAARDKKMIDYVMRDGMFMTLDNLMDEIYKVIKATKKLTQAESLKLLRENGTPMITSFRATRKMIKSYLVSSPNYENQKAGKDEYGRLITEYRYTGEIEVGE